MIIAVIGSRSFTNYEILSQALDQFTIGAIVSGGAAGADSLVEIYAQNHNIEMRVMKPEWSKYGRGAGLIRNKAIVDSADYVIAFWDGKSAGTKQAIKYAKSKNKPTDVINFSEGKL